MDNFDDEDDERLVELIAKNPPIFDCRLKSYKDNVVRENIWETIGNTMNRSSEQLEITLHGSAKNIEVFVDRQAFRFEDTFNTLIRRMSVHITNRSEEKLAFMCLQYKSLDEDFNVKFKFANVYRAIAAEESMRGKKLIQYKIVDSEEHGKIYSRILDDEIQTLAAEKFLFTDSVFSVDPLKGFLWEKCTTELVITFAPKQIGFFSNTMYLDIEGVEGRIPITMRGVSLPPQIKLNVETLDVGKPFVNKEYKYEIVAMNRGHINGGLRYKPTPNLFGSILRCEPACICLNALENKMFIITFQNPNQGPFFEEMLYEIIDTDIVLKLCFKGETVYPSLAFDPTFLDFGKVVFGVPKQLHLAVINEATVDVDIRARVLTDGPEENSIHLDDFFIAEFPKPGLPKWPKEIQIEPSKTLLNPHTQSVLTVTIIANIARSVTTKLSIEMADCDSPEFQVPIKYEVIHPQITFVGHKGVRARTCFLGCVYTQEVEFYCNVNSHFIAELHQEKDVDNEGKEIECVFVPREALIKADVTFKLECQVKVFETGRHLGQIWINLFGLANPVTCDIVLIGQAPIVTCAPLHISFGSVRLLKHVERKLTIFNDTPIAVEYTSFFLHRDGKFTIDKPSGCLDSESVTELVLKIHLRDVEVIADKLIIQINHLKDIVIPLTATGIGTSIVVGEDRNKIKLGKHFTRLPISVDVTMRNEGTKLHTLEWIYNYRTGKGVKQNIQFFQISPTGAFKIAAEEEITINIKCTSTKPFIVTEVWYLIGSVEGLNKKECLLECPISIVFLDPRIEVSKPDISLRFDIGPYNEFYKLTDLFTVKNISEKPLTLDVSVSSPFQLVYQKSGYKFDPNDPSASECICYNIDDKSETDLTLEVFDPPKIIDFVTNQTVYPLRTTALQLFQDIARMKKVYQLTNSVSQELEDGETMRVQVVFDITRHKTTKSKTYSDLIHLVFRRFRNKDCIRISGQINYPNLTVQPPLVDFQTVLNSAHTARFLKLENNTPVSVCYKLVWTNCELTSNREIVFTPHNSYLYEKPYQDESFTLSANESQSYQCPAPSSNPVTDYSFSDLTAAATASPIAPPPSSEAILVDPNVKDDTSDDKNFTKVLYALIDFPYKEPETIRWATKYLDFIGPKELQCTNLLDVVPHRGLIKSGEFQMVNVIFSPDPNIDIKAKLECHVLGGPLEVVTVTARSSDIQYMLSTDRLNYKIRLFSEKAKESLYLMNTALLPFTFNAIMMDKPKPSSKKYNECFADILEISPMSKTVASNEEVEISVTVNPGVMGNFELGFFLEIGHFELIPISIIGCGVIPQIYLSLERVPVETELSYRAIATLTHEFIEAVVELLSTAVKVTAETEEYEKYDVDKDWHVCTKRDNYPSLMDIDLALERLLVVDFISSHLDVLKSFAEKKVSSIPHFVAPPYIVDFGMVVIGTSVSCSAEIVNYSPVPIKPRVKKLSTLPSWLDVKICGKIIPGYSGLMDVTFTPSNDHFNTNLENVEYQYIIEVPSGAVIPVKMKAVCTIPCLVTNVKLFDFGNVRCGDKSICSIPFKNSGSSRCVWFAALQHSSKNQLPMTLLDVAGDYEAGEEGWVQIEFKPLFEGNFQAVLVFNIYMNQQQLRIPVRGRGIAPKVRIIGPDIHFPPTLPKHFADDIYFGVTNPCPFPIEIVIPEIQPDFLENQAIYELLNEYYDKPKEMLIPKRVAGIKYPEPIIHFFESFREYYKNQLRGEMHRARESSKVNARGGGGRAGKGTDRKLKKAATSAPKSASVHKIKTQAEIMADFIQHMKHVESDPLKECWHDIVDVAEETVETKNFGIMFALYSSPLAEADTVEFSYSMGKALNLPVINVDDVILDALVKMQTSVTSTIIHLIEECYVNTTRPPGRKASAALLPPVVEMEVKNESQRDALWRQLMAIGASKSAHQPTKISSRKTSVIHNNSRMDNDAANGFIPSFYLQEVLSKVLAHPKYDCGFVVVSLQSLMLRSPSAMFQLLLKSKPILKMAYLIVAHSDLPTWVAHDEAKEDRLAAEQEQADITSESEIEKIITIVDAMDADEYEMAPKDMVNIYIQHYLNERIKDAKEKSAASALKKMKLRLRGSRSQILGSKKSIADDLKSLRNKEEKKSEPKTGKKSDNPELANATAKYAEYQKQFEALVTITNFWNMEAMEIFRAQSSVEINNKKSARNKKPVNVPLMEAEVDPTFPLTIINGNPLTYRAALIQEIKTNPIVMDAKTPPKKEDILSAEPKFKEYSVLAPTQPPIIESEHSFIWEEIEEPPIPLCSCYPIDRKEDGTQDKVCEILNSWHCVCGKELELEKDSEQLTSNSSYTSSFPRSLTTAPTVPGFY